MERCDRQGVLSSGWYTGGTARPIHKIPLCVPRLVGLAFLSKQNWRRFKVGSLVNISCPNRISTSLRMK